MKQKKIILIKLFYLITTFLLLTWTFSAKLYIDESFTLGLIKHDWFEVIKLDAMDVHPPLYYLALKLFLTLTTFWTSSMLVKAIFARIFSVICFAHNSKGIQIILKKSLDKNINFNIVFLGLLLLPNVLYHATCIRMYAFGAMLITWEFVCLINYRQQSKTSYLIYALILAEMAAYTHYFAAIIGGLLLVYEFISTIKHKQFNSIIKLGICGISLLIFFIPWALVAFKQVSSVSKHYWMIKSLNNFIDLFFYHKFPFIIFYYIGFFIFITLTIICYSKGTNNFKTIYRFILFSFYGTMSIGVLVSIFIRPIFQSRYLFFIFPIYLSLTIYEIIFLIKKNQKKYKLLTYLVILFFSIGLIQNVLKGIDYMKSNYDILRIVNYYNSQNSKKNIELPFHNDFYSTIQYSIYLPNKNIIILKKEQKPLLHSIQTGNNSNNKKLFNKIYPNFKLKK